VTYIYFGTFQYVNSIYLLKSSLESELEAGIELDRERKEHVIPEYKNIDTTILRDLLKEFDGCFAYKIEDLKEGCKMEPIMLKLINHVPIRVPPYRCSIRERDEGRKEATRMLKCNVISHSKSPWNFPLILIP
jgi:hypothetical protein